MAAQTLIYPQDLGTAPWNQNHMLFKARKIIGVQGGGGATGGQGVKPAFGGNLGEVVLPIPTGLNQTFQQGWDQTQVGAGAAMGAGNFGGEIKALVDDNTKPQDLARVFRNYILFSKLPKIYSKITLKIQSPPLRSAVGI